MKALRVPLWALLVLALMAAAGIAGYFVPLDGFILTEQDVARKKKMEELNERLHSNIGATLRLLSSLNERTARLQQSKERNLETVGLPSAKLRSTAKQQQKATASAAFTPAAALQHIDRSEGQVAAFLSMVGAEGRSLFDTIPVIRPVDAGLSVMTRRFEVGRDPFTGKQKMHYGVDFAAEPGTPVVSTAAGVVMRVENDPIWGRRVTIRHGRDFRTVYAHLGTVKVAQGRAVRRGEEIGTVGMSGLSTGPHVHYEVWRGEERIDPEKYFFPVLLAAY